MTRAELFFNDVKDKKIAFIGTGVSHNDLIKMFLNKGLDVTICDKKTFEQMGELANTFMNLGGKLSLGENYLNAIYDVDIIFRTPGMYFHNEALQKAREKGIAVTSEMEIFFDLVPCKIYAITGTDGKTTTTTILTEMLMKSGKNVHKGGNIGRALLPIIEDIKNEDIAVVELSSFQLISMRKSPDVAIITNVYPDHLNVHSDMNEYVDAKKNLILHQNALSKTILNQDNEIVDGFSSLVRGKCIKFSHLEKVQNGAFLDDDGYLCYSDKGNVTTLFHKDVIKIPGLHNVENYLAAISAVWGDVSLEDMRYVAENFGGVEHRIEFVRELLGVKYYNDSIATSPVAVCAGLNAFSQKLIVIAGGSDKMLDYNMLSKPINEKVKTLILIGETANKIEKAVKSYDGYDENECAIIRANSMEEAVHFAKENAKNGDIVTLSPASASFDFYTNFEERGNHYKNLVNNLK